MSNDSTHSSRMPMRACTLVYLVMVTLTLVTWGIGQLGYSGLWVALAVLFFALLKGQLVGDWFMGLHGLRGLWRWVVFIWLFVPGVLITVAFVLSER